MDYLKGQYFSFDAVVATLIMVLAFTSLVGYWFGAQAVIDERSNSMYSDSLRVADSLLSPGVPQDWDTPPLGTVNPLDGVKQLGLTRNFTHELDSGKLILLTGLVGTGMADRVAFEANYEKFRKLLRAGSECYVVIERTDMPVAPVPYQFGRSYYGSSPSAVAVAHRGATLDGHPMSVKIFLWRNESG
ncbi:MAG: hypothetical protein WC588_00455 [Candidatus Micrarchaeia archaeon]